MPAAVAVLALALLAEVPYSLTPLPNDVVSAMAAVRTSPGDTGFKIPPAVPSTHLVRGDFDGNGYEDWAVLVEAAGRTAVLVAYGFDGEWRSGNVDVWGGPECKYCSRGPRPVSVTLLAPGVHERSAPHENPLRVNERTRICSKYPGLCVTFADGRRRAYYLVPHVWAFVDLGLER